MFMYEHNISKLKGGSDNIFVFSFHRKQGLKLQSYAKP